MSRQINQAGLDVIKSFEDLLLTAYPDPESGGAPWTIGYGHTGRVVEGDRITIVQAEALLREDLSEAEASVVSAVRVPLSDNQYAAMVSIVFNVGPGRVDTPKMAGRSGIVTLRNGQPSTLLRLLNSGDYAGAGDEFSKWTSGGMAGLVRRRAAERDLFLLPDDTEA
ncbi:lysozyme [Telmatospirillum sp.]|uniref:lysozyme n=1 Tax=Telmatospirillum sp. TaxID=2079197 RepID=UPI00284C2EA3|nr:lysozyme [Telmatospirillum sp.]MDR3438935.1 lysozyme [Telmatospirillum sp.]